MRKTSPLLILGLLVLFLAPLRAQDLSGLIRNEAREGVQQTTYMYGLGYANVLDTYLSPQSYAGLDLRIAREGLKVSDHMDGRLLRQSLLMGNYAYTDNRAENNHTMDALVSWSYGYLYRLPLETGALRILAGALGYLSGGFTYNLRNGNNPASLRASASIDASLMAVYDLNLSGRTIPVRYQISMPLLGAMFSPHFGESYYEIFCQDGGSGNIKLTTPFSRPSLRHILSADVPIGKKTHLRCAYIMDLEQSKLNGLRTHHYSHALMIGFVKEFLYL